jgi:hypothetical protein
MAKARGKLSNWPGIMQLAGVKRQAYRIREFKQEKNK